MTQVIIDDIIPRTQLIAAAGQTVFNTNWTANAASDVLVYARADGVEPDDETQLVSSSDYNVTFIGGSQTVRVTFLVGRTLDDIITIVRNTPTERMNLYVNTNFVPSMLNEDFGILTLVDQQSQMYDLVVNPGYNVSAIIDKKDKILPILEANQIWAMNNTNDEIIPYDVPASGSLAPGDAKYIVQQADSYLPNAQALGSLASGLVVNTTSTGVLSTRVLAGTAHQITLTNGDGQSGNPTVSITDNPIIPGTESMIPPKGTTAQRPSSPVEGQIRYNTDLKAIEVYKGGGVWDALSSGVIDSITGTVNEIDVDNTDQANPVLSLSATVNFPGTFTAQGTTAIDGINNDDTLASASATTLSTDLALKTYIDSRTDLHYMEAVLAASTGNFTSTYDNGTAGVGATLTATSNGAFSLDGEAGVLNGRYLQKDQTNTFENGIYTLTQVGDGSNPAILTRATDFDQAPEIDPGDIVPVLNGTVNGSTAWIQTATVHTIGTDAITFSQWTADFSNVVTLDGTQTITGDKTFTGTTQLDNFIITGDDIQHAGDTDNKIVFGTDTQDFQTGGSSRLDLSGLGMRLGGANARVTTILDQDNMASDSATALATQQSIKAYVDSQVGSSGGLKSVQVFTSNGTWTKPAGINTVIVEVLGGGGGGGFVNAGTSGAGVGTGGGAGAYAIDFVDVSSQSTVAVTVGAGGAGGIGSSQTAATAGGTSSFGAFISCTGGAGGAGMVRTAANLGNMGSLGGTSSGALFATSGIPSTPSRVVGGIISEHSAAGGTLYGGGGRAQLSDANGITATGRGAGGGGATSVSTNRNGGDGAGGLVIVWEFS